MWDAISDERTGLQLTTAAGPREHILRSEFGRTHDYILRPQNLRLSHPGGPVCVFISPGNRLAQLYPQALGWYLRISSKLYRIILYNRA
jgi:hypothetical protein